MAASLGCWSSGMKLSIVFTLATCGSLESFSEIGLGRLPVRGQHVDRSRADGRIAAQVEEGRDRFHLRAAQIDRVEIELQPIEQRQAGCHHEPGADDDRNAPALHESVDRRERLVSHLRRLAGRLEQGQQSGDQRDAGEERDDHAEAGEQSELGQPLVVGRQERQEAGRGGGGGERQRRPDICGGADAAPRAGRRPHAARRDSARVNWMPKSTPRPMNSTANATEIRLSAPTIANPTAEVIESPTRRLRTPPGSAGPTAMPATGWSAPPGWWRRY